MADAVIDNVFQSLIDDLMGTADNVSLSLQGTVQRDWRIPPNWETSPTDIPGFSDSFDRTEINGSYQDFFDSDTANQADCASTKLQADHIAMQERAFRMRHMTHIRREIHAAARRSGQSQGGGSFDRIAAQATDLLVSE